MRTIRVLLKERCVSPMMDCPDCGSDVSNYALSCPNCGFPIILYTSMAGKCETFGDSPLELIAMNPHTPLAILDLLSEDDNWEVRAALAENPRLSEAILHKLACDEDDDVRAVLANSSILTTAVMEKLSSDENCAVKDALCQNLSLPEYIRKDLELQLDAVDESQDEENCYVDNYYEDDYPRYDDDTPSSIFSDDCGNQYYRYGDMSLPYSDGEIEYQGRRYDVRFCSDGDEMFFDEDNGWLSDLP